MIPAFGSEWRKIWYPKSSRIYLPMAVIFSIFIGVVFSFTTQITQGRALEELKPMSIIEVNLLGVDIVTILLLFFTALQIGKEFQGKTIQTYLIATPSRIRYFMAKALTFFLLALAVGVIVGLVTLLNGQLITSMVHGEMVEGVEVWRFVLGCMVMPPFYVLLTVCATFSTGNTVGGILEPLVVMFLPGLATFFPEMLQEMVVPALPASAIHTLSGSVGEGSMEYMGTGGAWVILFLWILVSSLLAIWKFYKRDI